MSCPVRPLTESWLLARCMPEPNSGCWLWMGALTQGGYGKVLHNRKWRTAHRIAWEIFNGPVPPAQYVLHKCDVRLCVNPGHLFVGSPADNTQDMFVKGRHPSQKLTAQEASAIFASDELQSVLAKRYGVNQPTISNIKRGISWNRSTWRVQTCRGL